MAEEKHHLEAVESELSERDPDFENTLAPIQAFRGQSLLPVSARVDDAKFMEKNQLYKPDTNSPIWRPYTQQKTASPAIAVRSARGAYLETASGEQVFDGISSWWLITHGHCHPEIAGAVAHQAARLDQVTFANFTHEPAEELAELLIAITPPELTRVFFSDNGSTAVESALKMALQAAAQSGRPKKTAFSRSSAPITATRSAR